MNLLLNLLIGLAAAVLGAGVTHLLRERKNTQDRAFRDETEEVSETQFRRDIGAELLKFEQRLLEKLDHSYVRKNGGTMTGSEMERRITALEGRRQQKLAEG